MHSISITRIDRDHPDHDLNAENGAEGNEDNDNNQPPNDGRFTGSFRARCLSCLLFRGTWRRTVRRGRMNLVCFSSMNSYVFRYCCCSSSPLEIKTPPSLRKSLRNGLRRKETVVFILLPTMAKCSENKGWLTNRKKLHHLKTEYELRTVEK